MVDALSLLAIDTEDVGRLDCCWATTRDALTICPYHWKESRTPGIARFGQPCLPVAPRDEGGAPCITFAQTCIPQIFFYPFAVVTAGSFPNANFSSGDLKDVDSGLPRCFCLGKSAQNRVA